MKFVGLLLDEIILFIRNGGQSNIFEKIKILLLESHKKIDVAVHNNELSFIFHRF